MTNYWKRKGNLFSVRNDGDELGHYSIYYINEATCEIIKSITIEIDTNKEAYFHVWVSPFFIKTVQSVVEEIFADDDLIQIDDLQLESFLGYVHTIAFKSSKTFERLSHFFLHINKNYKHEFTPEIIEEFNKLAETFPVFLGKLQANEIVNLEYQHLIPLAENNIFISSDEENSNALLHYFRSKTRSTFNPDELFDLLKNGENPNQKDSITGCAIMMFAIHEFPEIALKILIFYGFNIFDKRNHINKSAMEICKEGSIDASPPNYESSYFEKLRILFDAAKERQISEALANKLTFKQRLSFVDLALHYRTITTNFHFGDGKLITTNLKPVENLLEIERISINELFLSVFITKERNPNATLAILAEDLIADNRHWIELIWTKEKLVAINLFEILDYNEIILHWVYSLRDRHTQLYQIPNLLGRRFAGALQWIFSDKIVWIQYEAIQYNGLRIMENDLYVPKYQTSQIMQLLHKNFAKIHDNELKLEIKSGIVCYSEEKTPLSIKRNPSSKNKSLGEYFYDTMRGLNCNEKNNIPHNRFVPVLAHVGDDLIDRYTEMGERIGLHALPHLELFKNHLIKALPMNFVKKISKSKFIGYASTRALFFSNKIKITRPISSTDLTTQNTLLSRL